MARYLTDEWFDEYGRLGAELPDRPGASASIQYRIEGPEPVAYHLVFADGRVLACAEGVLDDADVVLTMTYGDSTAIVAGYLDPNAAFSAGTIGFDGDMRALMSLLPVLWPNPTRRLGSARRYQAFQEAVREMTEF